MAKVPTAEAKSLKEEQAMPHPLERDSRVPSFNYPKSTEDYIKWCKAAILDGGNLGGWDPENPLAADTKYGSSVNVFDGVLTTELGQWAVLIYLGGEVTQRDETGIPTSYSRLVVSMWGPDKLACLIRYPYQRPSQVELRTCHYCYKENVPTVQLSFAGRACVGCRKKLVAEYEYPGWTK